MGAERVKLLFTNKMRSSTKIFIGFVAVVGIGWFAFNKIQDAMIMGQHFPVIAPARINIVGINTGAGYRVIVSNQLAQLVETQGGFEANESEDASDSSIKKRIPIKELLQTLQGNSESLGEFVMKMNDLSENDLPPIKVYWTKGDLEQAFGGNEKLRQKLESDLNMRLDGTPLPSLRLSSLENGIVLEVPVTVQVNINGTPRPVTGFVKDFYQPRLMKQVEDLYAADEHPSTDPKLAAISKAGYYKQEAQKILDNPKTREDIERDIESKISDERARDLVSYPTKILRSAFIILNDHFMTNADYKLETMSEGKPIYDLNVGLNDEGRRRLWQFSRNKVGDQLLVVSDGIAIAAPFIQNPLMGGNITVTRMRDRTILDDFMQTFQETKRGSAMASR